MTTEIDIVGTAKIYGHKSNIQTFSYSEDSTPHVPGDDSGALGEFSFSVKDFENNGILFYKDGILLRDTTFGVLTGEINSVNSSEGFLNVSGQSKLKFLNIEKTIAPKNTDLRGVFEEIFSASEITTDIIYSPSLPNPQVYLPGYTGDLWAFLKQICAVYDVEVSLINASIYVQPVREREISIETISSESYSLSEIQLSQEFDVAYYNYEEVTDSVVYPRGGWNPEVQVYQVEANETVTFEIEVDGFLTDIKQPIAQDSVLKTYSGTDSVFAASGSDGLPVSAAFWNNFGGSASVSLKDNGTKIEVVIKGPDFTELSPYTIGVSDGSTQYSTLFLVGSGILYTKEYVTIKTGLSPEEAPQIKGVEIDNPIISTRNLAIDAGVRARRRYSLPNQTFSASGKIFSRKVFVEYDYFTLDSATLGVLDGPIFLAYVPVNQLLLYSTFGDYNNTLPVGYLFSNFNTDYATASFEDFEQSLSSIFKQAFGTIPGSRVRYLDAIYRVRSSDVSPESINVTAEYDTLFSDFNDTFTSTLFGGSDSFNTIFANLTFTDYALIPLRTTPL